MKKILIIDDDEAILEVCRIILEQDFEVETATSGSTILNRKNDLPDLILLDILLSGEDGVEIARELKNKKKTKDIPIIMFSAHASGEIAARKVGVNLFLSKPFEVDNLVKMVKENVN